MFSRRNCLWCFLAIYPLSVIIRCTILLAIVISNYVFFYLYFLNFSFIYFNKHELELQQTHYQKPLNLDERALQFSQYQCCWIWNQYKKHIHQEFFVIVHTSNDNHHYNYHKVIQLHHLYSFDKSIHACETQHFTLQICLLLS